MRVLLDTHVFLWWITDDERLSPRAREVMVKGRKAHALHGYELPAYHRDPFDRLLVAQALLDGMPIVTADPEIARYPVEVIW